jgi:hypothetical protein
VAEAPALDFYIDADDAYTPAAMPKGVVKMGGNEYEVRCPKDSLPMLIGRIEAKAEELKTPAAYEDVVRQMASAVFEPDDVELILERVIDPAERGLSVAFLIDTVRRVYEAYGPYMDKAYEELGLENPVKKTGPRKPQDRQATSKPAAKKTTSRKPAARKTAARAR